MESADQHTRHRHTPTKRPWAVRYNILTGAYAIVRARPGVAGKVIAEHLTRADADLIVSLRNKATGR